MNKIQSKIFNAINNHKKIIIHRHKRPDLDSMGSQIALTEFIKLNFKDKEVIAATNDQFTGYEFIGKEIKVSTEDYTDALIILVDTANLDRADMDFDISNNVSVKIDHHPNVEPFGNIMYVDQTISSTSELLYHLFEAFRKENDFTYNDKIMYALFCGIFGDTGGFSFSNTSNLTFKAMSHISEYNIDYENTVLRLKSFDTEIVRALGYAYSNIEIENGIGIIVFDKQFQEQYSISPTKISVLANHLGMFKDLKAWVVFNEHDNFIRANFRSKGSLDISTIATQYNGGGHKNASGAMIYEWNEVEEIKSKLLQLVSED
ncbi:MAG: DHH family phosphoesterase [Mycoplasmatales bacterium]